MRGMLLAVSIGLLAGCTLRAEPLTSDAAVSPCRSHLPEAVKKVRTTVSGAGQQPWRVNFWLEDYQTGNQRPVGDPDFVCMARPKDRKVIVESFQRAPHDPQAVLPPQPRPYSGGPKERPRPTVDDVLAAAGEAVNVDAYRAIADAQPAIRVPKGEGTVGQVGGSPAYDYAWGDVENWEGGQEYFAPDAVVLRIVRCVDPKLRIFEVVAFDITTGRHAQTYQNGGGDRPVTWSYDNPSTAWAE